MFTTQRSRTRLAAGLFVLGLALPAFIPLLYLLPLNAWWLGVLTAGFALGIPELLWFICVLLIGKAGFRRLKRRTYVHVRSAWRRIAKPSVPGTL